MLIKRTGEVFRDTEGVEGRRLKITIGDKSWPAIERGGRYKWLRPGLYDVEFGYWTSSSGRRYKAIRVLGAYSQGRIYIHPANWPRQLTGCIAPGLEASAHGVHKSRPAIVEIFEALGGFREGFQFQLRVEGLPP